MDMETPAGIVILFYGTIFFSPIIVLIIFRFIGAKEMLCKQCGFMGKVFRKYRGHFLIEIILWCCFLIPGLIYSIWRISAKYYACPTCLAESVIPINSPNAQKILGENSPRIEEEVETDSMGRALK